MRRRIYLMLEKADHKDQISLFYDRFMIACIFVSLLPLCFKEMQPAFYWMDWGTALVFTVDYMLRWWTADFKFKQYGKKAYLRYPFTPFALIDLITILSSVTPLNSGLKIFRILRLPKCLRALKLLRYSMGFHLMVRVFHKEKEDLLTVCYLALGYVLVCGLVLFQMEPQTFPTYLDAVYWAAITLTTVGYGDFHPVTDVGKIIAIITSFVGIAVFALPTGIITAAYLKEIDRKK